MPIAPTLFADLIAGNGFKRCAAVVHRESARPARALRPRSARRSVCQCYALKVSWLTGKSDEYGLTARANPARKCELEPVQVLRSTTRFSEKPRVPSIAAFIATHPSAPCAPGRF